MVMYNSVPVSGGMVRLSVPHLSAQTGKRMECQESKAKYYTIMDFFTQ